MAPKINTKRNHPAKSGRLGLKKKATKKRPGRNRKKISPPTDLTPAEIAAIPHADTRIFYRRIRVAKLWAMGYPHEAIAKRVGVSRPTITQDLLKLREDWRLSAVLDIDERKGQELAKIDTLEAEAWDAWRRSQKDFRKVARKHRLESGAETSQPLTGSEDSSAHTTDRKTETTETTYAQVGDPRFLDRIHECIAQRCKIIGLYAPVRTELDARVIVTEAELLAEAEAYGIEVTQWSLEDPEPSPPMLGPEEEPAKPSADKSNGAGNGRKRKRRKA